MRYTKRMTLLLLAAVLTLSFVGTVRASGGQVTYSGNAGAFIFEPGSAHSPTDLFPDFKAVMPGDCLEQRILLKNDADQNVKVKIYIRALGAHRDSVEFLSQLHLRVEKPETEIMFEAASDQSAQLADWVCLGTLYSGGELELKVILEVPVTLDNRYQDQIGFLDWEFMVEEFPVEESDPDAPDTGDDTGLLLYGGLFAVSAGVLLLLIPRKKRDGESVHQ